MIQLRVLIASLAIITPLLAGCGGLCGNHETKRVTSPSGKWTAVAFTRDCGATTGTSSQVSILAKDSILPNEPGNVLVLEAPVLLDVSWSPAGELVIHGTRHVKRFKEETSVFGVKILYP